MKLTIVGPSPQYENYAGPKIRYRRIMPDLERRGIDVEITDIGQFDPLSTGSDAVLISKCHDPRALVSAAILRDRGILTGVDIFDDYFSQRDDSRLVRFRAWLAQLLPICDFALCSTPRLAGVIGDYRDDIPILVMNDPGPAVSLDTLATNLALKLAKVRETQKVRIAWFGVGDNPHFRVGLHDLAAFGNALRQLRRGRMDVELNVLTNVRALTGQGLASLRQLPVLTSIEEWTEEREHALLDASYAVFLPVNESAFSVAKSLNRAVTALTSGCQILSVGHPLYAPLDPLIYRTPEPMVDDIEAGVPKLRSDTLETLKAALLSHASPETEGAKLADFLGRLEPPKESPAAIALVHGHSTNGLAHKLVQSAGGLSIASPACSTELGFDVIFRNQPGMTMLVSAKARRRLAVADQERLHPAGSVKGRKFFAKEKVVRFDVDRLPDTGSLPFQLATYRAATKEISDRVTATFGTCRIIVSETSQLPFRPAV